MNVFLRFTISIFSSDFYHAVVFLIFRQNCNFGIPKIGGRRIHTTTTDGLKQSEHWTSVIGIVVRSWPSVSQWLAPKSLF
jgi:hypothetical protein